jgi:uridine kinase
MRLVMRRFDLDAIGQTIATKANSAARPIVVAIDGRSGAGKSTLARELAGALGAAVISGDDFFTGGVVVRGDSAQQRAADCIDWRRQRAVLLAIRNHERASWHAFNWQAFDGSVEHDATGCAPERIVLLEGVYSARPELADLLDLRMLVRVPDEVRMRQLVEREGSLSRWELQWHEAEDHYFANVISPGWFDLTIEPITFAR